MGKSSIFGIRNHEPKTPTETVKHMLHHAPHEAVPSLRGKKGHGWFAAEIWDIQKMEIQLSNIVKEMTKNKDIP
jgi:hypothetical protein